jgi:hypothetical protein
VAQAKAEGRAEAEAEGARLVAAAEFRAAAAGRLTNVDAALAALDLGKLLGDDGKPDRKAIARLVEQLAPVPPAPPPPGRVPTGPRELPNGVDTDWLRAIKRPVR